eukprot:CAMPEP_0201676944 /NCGR_PEP_ID=MMETSP0494-20130426/42997_1 /ASSEMBLY_ACC=CAM_ASM_000839 /TAXON_ID=420259 /ORGANISM="Thalassiosira gravida, Strain GMp14c1" /LENGTH=494 /DNA_ID=CAMNT_0048159781 /DNA_START=16 /DNA_END=1500 /DNA_ORIENTATION=+
MTSSKSIAIIGGGITGVTAAWKLSKYDSNLTIHLFDQGRRGVGGRTSSRSVVSTATGTGGDDDDDDDDPGDPGEEDCEEMLRFDHGCQFFRADTSQFREIVTGEWRPYVREWKGHFYKSNKTTSSSSSSSEREFFGMPSTPPFYVGLDGMQSLTKNILDHVDKNISSESESSPSLRVFTGTRVANLERDPSSQKWKLHGTSGTAAYHDTSEKVAQQLNNTQLLGEGESGYDAVILTDVSSSFGKWHRASAGVPEHFAKKVRERVGARVPLFSAMVAFDGGTGIPFDAASFDDDPVVWFAARSNSKPGMEGGKKECWTIVSTPEYAMAKIKETPMQDPKTNEFIPQSDDYLTSVPGPDLCNAFKRSITNRDGILGENALESLPEVVHVDAQRWGSALPCHRHLRSDDSATTRRIISGVTYDAGRFPLAPTKEEGGQADVGGCGGGGNGSFLVDEGMMLLQAGDMVSNHTPGLESAALSGYYAAGYLHEKLHSCTS